MRGTWTEPSTIIPAVSGAKRFLLNIVQYPGAQLFGPASYVALNPSGIWWAFLWLPGLEDLGTLRRSVCRREERKTGAVMRCCGGLERLWRSMGAKTSLTVTASNQEADRLYQRMGFRGDAAVCGVCLEGF